MWEMLSSLIARVLRRLGGFHFSIRRRCLPLSQSMSCWSNWILLRVCSRAGPWCLATGCQCKKSKSWSPDFNPVKQPIQNNFVGSWHMSHRAISAFDYHLNHGFIVFIDIQHGTGTRMCSAWWNVTNVGQVFVVGIGFRILGCIFADKFLRGPLTHLWFSWFGLVRNEILQPLNPKDGERESHPCVNVHRERLLQPSVELCETEVCFLHIHFIGTNVWLPRFCVL